MSNVVKVLAAMMHTDLYSLGNCCTQWVLSNGRGEGGLPLLPSKV